MSILTIILFLIYTWGLGYSLTFFIKEKNLFEMNIIRMGIGLGAIPLVLVILNLFKIPINWWLILILSLIIPIQGSIKNKFRFNFKVRITKSNIFLFLVFLLFLITLFMYTTGAFSYPYLEDDDPWGHAGSIKYISEEKVLDEPFEDQDLFQYIDPYPPGYDGIMALLYQTSPSLKWTLKFFNVMFISLGLIFFYLFSKNFIGDSKKAAFATFLLFAIPSYLTHFIWAHSLVVTLFFPALYCLESIKKNKLWSIPSSICISSILLVQPTQAIKFGFFFIIYYLVRSFFEKSWNKEILFSGAAGVLLSMFWWLGKISSFVGGAAQGAAESGKSIISPDSGTATRAYTFSDFVFSKSNGLINNQPGWGIIISILLVIGLVYIFTNYKKLFVNKQSWVFISLAWFIFTFIGVNSLTFNLPIGLFAFRFWMLLAIPVSILATQGLWPLFSFFNNKTVINIVLIFIVITGVFFTSFVQKYTLNTDPWPPGGGWKNSGELEGYTMLKELPPDTKVFPFTGTWQAWAGGRIIGMDKYFCMWCEDEMNFDNWYNRSPEEVSNFLINKGYEFALVDSHFYNDIGINKSQTIIKNFIESGNFRVEFNNGGSALLRVI